MQTSAPEMARDHTKEIPEVSPTNNRTVVFGVRKYVALIALAIGAAQGKAQESPVSVTRPTVNRPLPMSPDEELIAAAKLDEPDVAKLAKDMDAADFRVREVAQNELRIRIENLLKIQNPPPKNYGRKISDADNGSAEQRGRTKHLLGMASLKRVEEGSKFPPIKGPLVSVLNHIEQCTGTALQLPKGFKSEGRELEIPLGENTVWQTAEKLEKLGLYISHTFRNQVVFTENKKLGYKMLARSGSATLLNEAREPLYRTHNLAYVVEPGMGEVMGITGATSNKGLWANVQPISRGALWGENSRDGGDIKSVQLRKIFPDGELVVAAKGTTRIEISALMAKQQREIRLPIEMEKVVKGILGPRHEVKVTQKKNKQVTVTLTHFADVPYMETRGDEDWAIRRMGKDVKISFFDAAGKELPVLIPYPDYSMRESRYVFTPPEGAVGVCVQGWSETGSTKNTFMIQAEAVLPKKRVGEEPEPTYVGPWGIGLPNNGPVPPPDRE